MKATAAGLGALGERLVETHISWVVLTSDRAFKVKKPVDFGFLDFTTLDRRRAACEAEVQLNRRLAPAVYLGVVPVTGTSDDGALAFGGDGPVVDWAVEMRRLDDDQRADERLVAGALGPDDIDRIAETLVAFHARAGTSSEIARWGQVGKISVNVRENFAQTRGQLERVLSAEEAREIEAWQLGFLEAHGGRFETRVSAGRIRDGHGDLRLDHVYLETGIPGEGDVTVVDGIEFNERFRYADVAADIAFLSMDLAWHGRVDLAERLLGTYAREAGDYDLYGLVDFYESYRAFVRGKVDLFVAGDPDAPTAVRERKRDEARRHLLLALASERRRLAPPAVVAVGGVVASGKSTWANRIALAIEAPVVSSDRTRKDLLGVDHRSPAGDVTAAYDAATTDRTYAEVLRRGSVVLASGRPVVFDATFHRRARRRDARALARELGVPFLFVECRAPRSVLVERLVRRGDPGGTVSDARVDLLDRFLDEWEPVDDTELAPQERTMVHTDVASDDDGEWNGLVARLPVATSRRAPAGTAGAGRPEERG